MTHFVVDTNVPVVANGRDGNYCIECRIACVAKINEIKTQARHRVILDNAGEILAEYRGHLNAKGQPGVGDEFYRYLLNMRGNRKRILEVELHIDPNSGEYAHFPSAPALAKFDPADRKFVAAARAANARVLNAIDPDWEEHKAALRNAGVTVVELCSRTSAS